MFFRLLCLSWCVVTVTSFGGVGSRQCSAKDELNDAISSGGAFDLTAHRGVILTSGQTSTKFTLQSGALQETEVLKPVFSASKLVSSILINRIAEEEGSQLDLDAPVSSYVSWWTADPQDARSGVTLRHMLSMTSGFGSDPSGDHGPPTCELQYMVPCVDDAMGLVAATGSSCTELKGFGCDFDLSNFDPVTPKGTFVATVCPASCGVCENRMTQESCSKDLYEKQFGNIAKGMFGSFPNVDPADVKPGSHFTYGESNWVMAIHAVEKATGQTWNALFKKYLTNPLNLATSCSFPDVPLIDGGAMLECSSAEYSKIVAAYFRGEIVKQITMDEMEKPQTKIMGADLPMDNRQPPVTDGAGVAHYGLGMWRACTDESCAESYGHSIGADGVNPIIDRVGGYWALVFREGGMFQGKPYGMIATMNAMSTVVSNLRKVYRTCQL